MTVDRASVLFITLDSCRFDTFAAADVPNLSRFGPVHRAFAPGTFTYSSHAAMFMGFTPGDPLQRKPYVNPKFGRIFRMVESGAHQGPHPPFATLPGRDVVAGFGLLGYRTVGTGAVRWFDPATPTTRTLTESFEKFFYPGATFSLRRQLDFVLGEIDQAPGPVFTFVNIGETHVPYWHEGAEWARTNPCRPFTDGNDAAECRRRQLACLEWVDAELEELLGRFSEANVIICADHGDAWGEDDLWEHGIHHPTVLQVPLLFQLGSTIGAPQ